MRNYALCFFFAVLAIALSAQPWEQDDSLFNPSGIPSLTFSQVRFNDIDADTDFDFWLGNTSRAPLFIENSGSAQTPEYSLGEDLLADINYLHAEVAISADIDSDGSLDLICGGYSGLFLYLNTGTAYSVNSTIFSALNAGHYPVPDMADVDNDGDLDLILGFSESGAVKLCTNTGTPANPEFLATSISDLADVGLYAYPVFCDYDSDGDYDILIGRDVHGFTYLQNNGDAQNPLWEDNSSLFSGLGMDTYWNSGDLADIDGNGLYELIYGTSEGPLRYFVNSGTVEAPIWQENESLFGGVIDVGGASSPFFYDWDGDGDLDMLSGTQMGYIKYFRNTGTPFSPAWEEDSAYFSEIDHSIYAAVTAGDANGDGLPDLIVGDLSGELYYYQNNGMSLLYQPFMLMGIDVGDWSVPRLVEYDTPGILDLMVGNEDGELFRYDNTGTAEAPNWQSMPGFFPHDIGSNCSPSFGDLDEDGDLDVVIGDAWGDLHCYINNGGLSWQQDNSIFAGILTDQNAAPALVDIDHDGDLDLVLGDYDGTFKFYRNLKYTGSPLNPPQNPSYSHDAGYMIIWQAPEAGSGSVFEHYNLYLNDAFLGNSSETFWLLGELPIGTHTLQITAQYMAGESLPVSLVIEVVSIEDNIQSPITLSNYPNPFNPTTTIRLNIPSGETGTLDIYNLKGQLIKRYSGLQSGSHDISWDAMDKLGNALSSGLYMYRLKTESRVLTRKMMLMK